VIALKLEPNQMSLAPLMLSFLISNKLDPTTSITSASWVTAARPALRSIRSSANAIVTRLAGAVAAASGPAVLTHWRHTWGCR
jgi:hypothetical protein